MRRAGVLNKNNNADTSSNYIQRITDNLVSQVTHDLLVHYFIKMLVVCSSSKGEKSYLCNSIGIIDEVSNDAIFNTY